MTRHRKGSNRPFASLLLLFSLACSSAAPSAMLEGAATAGRDAERDGGTQEAQPLVGPRILALRQELSRAQRDYADALAGRAAARQAAVEYVQTLQAAERASPPAAARIGTLSAELRQEVSALTQAQTGGEVAVAVHRARVEVTLTKLQLYEQACGIPSTNASTELSVLTHEELGALRKSVNADLVQLQTEAARYHASELPAQLQARVAEVKRFHGALAEEVAARATDTGRAAKSIPQSLTVAEARARVPTLAELEGPGASRYYYKRLWFQLEVRKFHSPGDAALSHLAGRIKLALKIDPSKPPPPHPGGGAAPPEPPRPGPGPASPSSGVAPSEVRPAQSPRGWEGSGPRGPPPEPPTPSPSPPGRPPTAPSSGGAAALDPAKVAADLGRAAQREASAVMARDPVLIAQTRAQITTDARWFQTALSLDASPSRIALSSLESEELLGMREGYQRFYGGLAEERILQPANPAIELELAAVRQRIEAIDGVLRARHLPSGGRLPVDRGPEMFVEAARRAPRSPALLACEQSRDAALARQTSVELRLQMDLPRATPDQTLYRAYQASLDARLTAQAELVERSFKAAQNLSTEALIHGRGELGTGATLDSLSAQRGLELETQSLRLQLKERLHSAAADKPSLRAALQRLEQIPIRAARHDFKISLDGALTRLERAAMTMSSIKADAQEVRLGIQSGRAANALESVDIHLRGNTLPRNVPGVRVPQNFQSLFPKDEGWTQSFRGLTRDLERAPGGVIIEGTLPPAISRRLEYVRLDPASGTLMLRLGGVDKPLEPPLPLDVTRAAWAFVLDGRAVAVDLRYLDREEVEWLLAAYGAHRPLLAAQENWNRIHEVLALVTSVNLHPALAHTRLGHDFIGADDLIFDLLQDQSLRSSEREHKYGLDLRGLRDAYSRDYPESLRDLHYRERLFSKSILSVREVRASESAHGVRVQPQLSFDVFSLAVEGRRVAPRRLEHSSAWFAQHGEVLRQRMPALARVTAFAQAVAIFRAVRLQRIANNLDVLALRSVPLEKTPRLLCRGRVAERCKGKEFQRALNLSPDSSAVN